MSGKAIAGIVVVLLVILGAVYVLGQQDAAAPNEAADTENGASVDATEESTDAPAGSDEQTDQNQTPPSQSEQDGTSAQAPAGGTAGDNGNVDAASPDAAQEAVIRYTASGFEPETVRISSGVTVRWVNESGNPMWVASAVHPTHEVYGGTSLSEHCPDANQSAFDQCQAGDEYSFTFGNTGSWDYHNHVRPTHTGTVVVQ